MGEIVLYHGSFNKVVVPQYGLGETKHDYGKGFYLTENVELAKEWAVCRPDETNGWVHKFELDTKDLKVLDFQQYNVLSWLAELMKHRDAADTRRYKMLSKKFIAKYGIDTSEYDVIKGGEPMRHIFILQKNLCVTTLILKSLKNCYRLADWVSNIA